MTTSASTEDLHSVLKRNVSEIITPNELEEKLKSGQKLTVYLGVDPSSPEIHLGHAVVLWKLRQFQKLGHTVILLIGDFTAQIGDPTGKSKERTPLTHEQVIQNAQTYKEQASKILQFDGENPAQIRFNHEWLSKLNFADVVKLASHFTVQQMIERDMFQARLKENQSIGLHEFLYPLMVGYDSVHMDVDVEIGGNDQLFNIKTGRTLMEKMTGKKKVVLTCDLLTGSDGSKMSKSAGNIIPLTATDEDMFGKLMAISDALIFEYARLCSDMNEQELAQLEERLKSDENPRDIKLDVAENIVSRYGDGAAARQSFMRTFSQRTTSAPTRTLVLDMDAIPLIELVVEIIGGSKSEARRLILGRAVDIDGKTEDDADDILALDIPHIIKIGKHTIVEVKNQFGGVE